jgi:hypothetical protein
MGMGFVMRDLTRRWPASHIPFEIDPALSIDQRQIALDAIFFWNNTAGVLLTPHANEPDFLFYIQDPAGLYGGQSDIGRSGGKQIIRMDFGWSEAVGALLHETGHAAGLLHEHQRPDRDQYVVAPPQTNPPDGNQVIDITNVPIGPYDCRSVMQYYISATDPTAFRAKAPGCWYPYHGIMLSQGDVRALQSLYWGGAWVARQAAARDVGVGADGSAWIVGSTQTSRRGFDLSRWDGSTWHPLPGAAVRISAASEVAAWCVDGAGAIYQWNEHGGSWNHHPGPVAVDIAMGADGSVWMVAANPPQGELGVYRWEGGWVAVPSNPIKGHPINLGSPGIRIAAASKNEAWIVTAAHEIFHWQDHAVSWNQLPGTAHDIGVGADGTVGITTPLGAISFWSPERSQWVVIDSPPLQPGTSSKLIEIAIAPNGLPWVANADFATFERTLGPGL